MRHNVFNLIGQAMHIVRDSQGKIVYHDSTPWKNSDFDLAPGVPENEPNRAGTGFCFSLSDNKLHEVTDNNEPSYNPMCTLRYYIRDKFH